jgi:hypothetical protein
MRIIISHDKESDRKKGRSKEGKKERIAKKEESKKQ